MRVLPLAAVLVFFPAAVPAASLDSVEARIVAFVDAHQEAFITDLEAALRIDSATENLAGVARMGDFYRRHLDELGFNTRWAELPASTGRSGHLLAERQGTQGQRVLLLGHLDTVYPGGAARREGTRLHGSGAADMKGGNMVMLQALRALHAAGALADTRLIVMLTGDEEAPGLPQEITRRDLREAGKRSDLVLAFESAVGMTGTIARRGVVTWELEVQGATGHSSGIFSAAMGSGSVYEAARILQGFHEELRTIDGITANPALIAGGAEAELDRTGGKVAGKTNIVAQRTLVRGDLRFLSAEQLAEARARMEAVVARGSLRTSAVLKFHEGYPAMPPSEGSLALLDQLDRVSRDLGHGPITAFDPRGRGAGDIAFVAPPLPGLDGLGLGGEGEHTPRESAHLTPAPELVKRAALLIYRLTRYQGVGVPVR